MGRHTEPRIEIGRRPKAVGGVMPGGTDHRLLLALRGVGGMSSDQVYARFTNASSSMLRLKALGLIEMPGIGQKEKPVRLTAQGRALTEPTGPLSRSKNLITYCQL